MVSCYDVVRGPLGIYACYIYEVYKGRYAFIGADSDGRKVSGYCHKFRGFWVLNRESYGCLHIGG